MWILVLLVIGWLLVALVPASIAAGKERSFGGFYVFALFFFLPALIVALLLPDPAVGPSSSYSGLTRPCPHCLSAIPRAASVCGQCRRDVAAGAPSAATGTGIRIGIGSGSRVCQNPTCDARGIRTEELSCPVCDSSLEAPVAARRGPVPLAVAANPGRCANARCQAAGIPTTGKECQHCGFPVAQPA